MSRLQKSLQDYDIKECYNIKITVKKHTMIRVKITIFKIVPKKQLQLQNIHNIDRDKAQKRRDKPYAKGGGLYAVLWRKISQGTCCAKTK